MAMNGIIARLAENASFLWLLRSQFLNAPHFSLHDLALLDERLAAQIDGLRVAGEAGWNACKDALRSGDSEPIFPAAVLAFERDGAGHTCELMEVMAHDQAKARVLISALGWLSYEIAKPHITKFLTSKTYFHRYIGIAASAIHRRDPGHHLKEAACAPEPLLKARALRAYGELGRSRELNVCQLREALAANDDGVRFSAAWSGALAGNGEAVEALRRFAMPSSAQREKALNTALRRMDQSAVLSWQKNLAASPDTVRLAVSAAGALGDPILIPWLIEQMETPALARVAGEAFTMTTGVDIALEGMKGAPPEGFRAGPNDDPIDQNVAMDLDRALPWPDAKSISAWWHKNEGKYQCGVRHLLGKPVSDSHLRHILVTGAQKPRSAAALELAMMHQGQPLYEVRAPAFRQLAGIQL